MSLLNIKISKLKTISLKEGGFHITAPPAALTYSPLSGSLQPSSSPAAPGGRSPTAEQILYKMMVTRSPFLEELIARFDLVSASTGEPIVLM